MKKFLLSVFLILLVLSLGISVFASNFSDVKGTKYEDSVEMLTLLKVINGYDDGTYKPDRNVKRSEMAKLLVVALGKEGEVKSNASSGFPDVPSSHWAAGYIKVANDIGLIKGYTNGRFAPDDTISYAEAVTMFLRALNYGEELENIAWPSGYMEKAKDLKITGDVDFSNSNEDATRGNISLMLWRVMQSSVREIVASNNNGMIYGDGDTLLEKSFDDYLHLSNIVITDVDVDNKYLIVIKNKVTYKLQHKTMSEKDVKKLYGKTIESAIYDLKNNKFLKVSLSENESTVNGTVTKISDDKIYIGSKSYAIPSEKNIKLIGITDLYGAEDVYITLSGSKVKYVLAEGTETLYVGLITRKGFKIDGDSAVEIETMDGTEEYVLYSSSTFVVGDVIIYSLTSDDELVVKQILDEDDAREVTDVTSTSIKLSGKTKRTFTDDDNYIVVGVDRSFETVEEWTLKTISEEYDLAMIVEKGDMIFVIVYLDEADIEDDETLTKTEAKTALKDAISRANKVVESKWTIASYENMSKALTSAKSINTSKATASVMQSAAEKLDRAIDSLVAAKTSDKNIRAKYANLEAKIKEAEALDEEDYTAESYANLKKKITTAKNTKLTSTLTVAKIESLISDIQTAINELVTNVSAEQLVTATNRLKAAIAEAKLKKEADYTSETYSDLKAALTLAEKVDYTTAGSREINQLAINLEAAIDALVSKEKYELNLAKETLSNTLTKIDGLMQNSYTVESWNELTKVKEEVLLYKIELLTTSEIKALNTKLENAISNLVLKTDELAKEQLVEELTQRITRAKKYTQTEWESLGGTVTWTTLQAAISSAESAVANSASKTLEELKVVHEQLGSCLGI